MSIEAEQSRPFAVDVGKAERAVWLVKVPAFVASQWQALPLLQEREAARARAEPALVPVVTAALRCVCSRCRGPDARRRLPPYCLGSVLHTTGELSAGWDNARKADDFHRLLTCVQAAYRCLPPVIRPTHSRVLLQRPRGAWQHRRRDAVSAGARVIQVCTAVVLVVPASTRAVSLRLTHFQAGISSGATCQRFASASLPRPRLRWPQLAGCARSACRTPPALRCSRPALLCAKPPSAQPLRRSCRNDRRSALPHLQTTPRWRGLRQTPCALWLQPTCRAPALQAVPSTPTWFPAATSRPATPLSDASAWRSTRAQSRCSRRSSA